MCVLEFCFFMAQLTSLDVYRLGGSENDNRAHSIDFSIISNRSDGVVCVTSSLNQN